MMHEIGERHPHLTATRYFLFGLFHVRAWEYRCVYSNAQLELMCADRTRVEYTNPKEMKKGTKEDYEECIRLNMESIRRIRERRAKGRTNSKDV